MIEDTTEKWILQVYVQHQSQCTNTPVEKGDHHKDLFVDFEHSKFCRAPNVFLYVDMLVGM